MGQATIILTTQSVREQFCRWVMKAPPRTIATLKGVKRSIPQNNRLWALLTDVATQATWQGKKRTTEQWKDLFSGAFLAAAGNLEIVPGLEGGFMILGLHTSEMSVAEMADLQTYIEAWGAQNGVTFSDFDSSQSSAGANNPRAEAA
jgi:hypothetical protein